LDKRFFFFGGGKAEGRGDMKDILGGKGAGLAEMTNAGLPVPPGFTISTQVCHEYLRSQGRLPQDFEQEQRSYLGRLEEAMEKRLGDPSDPLLVSVRSGAKFSMPGMMDTVLNLGLNDRSVLGLAARTGNERFAWDAYRRFLQMFGAVVLDVEKRLFESEIEKLRRSRKVPADAGLQAADFGGLVSTFKDVIRRESGTTFPEDPYEQLCLARDAVFKSWNNPRARYYRRQNRIPEDLGTAVNVQAMVFGNMGEDSGTGVGFTRNPATGANEFYGEYLTNAQGEDVVAGIRTPRPISELRKEMPRVYEQLHDRKRAPLHAPDADGKENGGGGCQDRRGLGQGGTDRQEGSHPSRAAE
jgi:pyruvate,orthophosphate dikinase